MEASKKNLVPIFLKPYFWSYDFAQLDARKHRAIIIKNILNYGDQQAVNWLFKQYSFTEIKTAFATTYAGEYDKKSLNFWQTVFNLNLPDRVSAISPSL